MSTFFLVFVDVVVLFLFNYNFKYKTLKKNFYFFLSIAEHSNIISKFKLNRFYSSKNMGDRTESIKYNNINKSFISFQWLSYINCTLKWRYFLIWSILIARYSSVYKLYKDIMSDIYVSYTKQISSYVITKVLSCQVHNKYCLIF